jgi:hypothetical protein
MTMERPVVAARFGVGSTEPHGEPEQPIPPRSSIRY